MVQLSQLFQDFDLLAEQVLALGQVLLCDGLDGDDIARRLEKGVLMEMGGGGGYVDIRLCVDDMQMV